jgi:hypothetical protein
VANSAALLLNLRHYTNGEAVPYFDLSLADQWWWQSSLVDGRDIWLIGTVAGACYFTVLTLIVVGVQRAQRDQATARPVAAPTDAAGSADAVPSGLVT